MSYSDPVAQRPWFLPTLAGAIALVAAGVWWIASKPSGAEVSNARLLGRDIPEQATAGPLLLLGVSAVLFVIAAILSTKQRT